MRLGMCLAMCLAMCLGVFRACVQTCAWARPHQDGAGFSELKKKVVLTCGHNYLSNSYLDMCF